VKYGIPTCSEPTDPKSMYMRNLYHSYFWGPFKNELEVINAINILDKADPYWDYDPFCIIFGADPLPHGDFTFGFKFVDDVVTKRIHAARLRKQPPRFPEELRR